jgi:serine protease AprX
MLSRHRILALALGVVGVFPLNSSAFAKNGCSSNKCSKDLSDVSIGNVSVIIQYKHATSLLNDLQLQALAAAVNGHLTDLNAIAVKLPAPLLDVVAQLPDVAHISLDHPIGARGVVTPISTSPEFTGEPINAQYAWAKGYDGSGVGVAVIDSGVTPVDDLNKSGGGGKSRIVYSQSFVPGETNITTDAYGHGTHVAGLIAGNGADSTGKAYSRTFTGIAPNANIINLRVLDENGVGSDSAVISAIQTAIQLQSKYNIRVINLSLGRPIYESYLLDPLCQAVEQAWQAGIMVVVAAGNDGRDLALNPEAYGTIEAPGNDPYALTVGAVRTMGTAGNTDDAMASYSSKGPTFIDQVVKPDVVAPGNLVTSLLSPNSNLQAENPVFFTPLSST